MSLADDARESSNLSSWSAVNSGAVCGRLSAASILREPNQSPPLQLPGLQSHIVMAVHKKYTEHRGLEKKTGASGAQVLQ